MATINLGSIKFNWQGAYAGGTAYAVDDVVSYNGTSYICILASTGNLPTNATYWNVMAQGGTDVGTTLTTQGDLLYRDGSGLQRLGAGTSGQVLQTGGTGANPSWGTVSSDAGTLSFLARPNADLGLGANTYNEIVFNETLSNTGTKYSTSTGRYTPGAIGTYFMTFSANIAIGSGDTNQTSEIEFRVNGSDTNKYGYQKFTNDTHFYVNGVSFSAVINLASTSDYISLWFKTTNGNGGTVRADAATITGFKLT